MGFYSHDNDGDQPIAFGREGDWTQGNSSLDDQPYYVGVSSSPETGLISLRMIAPGLVPDVRAEHRERDRLANLSQHFVLAVEPVFEAVNLLVQETGRNQIGKVKLGREGVSSNCVTASFPQGAKTGVDNKLYLGFSLPIQEDGSLLNLSFLRADSAAGASIPVRLNAIKSREKYLFTLGVADFLWAIGHLIAGIRSTPVMMVLLANPFAGLSRL